MTNETNNQSEDNETTVVQLKRTTVEKLMRLKGIGDSYNDIIERLLAQQKTEE